MLNKIISIKINKSVFQLETIHRNLNLLLKKQHEIDKRDLFPYVGTKEIKNLQQAGSKFYLRQLNRKKDKFLIDKWQQDLNNDISWHSKWKKKYGTKIDSLPLTKDVPEYAYGLISSIDKQQKLEGMISLYPSTTTQELCISISKLELYYKNIGDEKSLKGLADFFMDFATKIAVEITKDSFGVKIEAATPGSKNQVKKRDYASHQQRYHFLSRDKTLSYYDNNNLDDLLSHIKP